MTYTRVASIAVVFVMLAVSFNTMCVSAPPETAQDWIIVGNERYEDGDFYQGTNIVVESGGSLALVDCSVTLYDHSDHAIDFSVKAGGKLEISNCTIVGELSTYYGNTRWTFRIYGSALLNSSKLTGLGGRGPIGGVQVYSNDVAIVSTEIEDSSSSAVFVDKASPYLYGNIVRNSVYGYYFNGSVTTQTLTTFSDGNATQTRQFVGPGSSANITLTLPKRAQLSQAEMSITGSYLQPSTSSGSPWANGLVRANGIDEGYWYKNWDPAGYIWGIFAADSTNGIRVVCDGFGSRLLVPIYSRLPGVGGDLLSPTDVTSNGDYMYVIDGTHVDMFRTLAGSIYWFDTLTGFIKAPKGIDYYNGILCIADRTYKLVIYGREAGPITTELTLAISDVSVCSSGIYVLDGTHIDVFTLDGVWRYKITQGLGRPNRIDVRDKIYVSDETYGLVVLNLDGTLVYRGAPGLSVPKGVAASSFNKVYVQDSGNHLDFFDCGYPASPSLDIGCDGDVDWSVSGGFESTIKMNSSNSRILDELGSFTQADGSGDVEIPMSISSGSTGVTTLSGLRIDYSVQPVFYSNLAQDNGYGVVFNNTSAVYCNRTLSLNNGVGFCFWNSSPTVRDSTVLFSGTYDLAFESGSHPNLVRTNYSKQSVSITGSPDSDNDGLSDAAETYVYGTDPLLNDTDGDGFSDGWEILHGGNPLGYGSDGVDSDSDMLGDYYEDVIGTNRHNADSDGDGLTDGFEYYVLKSNPLSADSDSDGLADMVEFRAGTNLTSADSDSDGVRDGDEISWSIDTDGDGLINANDNDSDGDGLGDGLEAQIGTSMVLADTDSDSVTDYAENEFWERATFVGPAVFTDTFDSGADGWTKVGDGGFVEIYPWFGDPADPCLELGRTQLTGNVSAWHNFTPQYNHFVAEMAVIATAPWSGSKVDIVFAADDGAWSFNLTRVFSNLYAFPSGKSVGPMWNYAWDNVWYELKINVDLFNGTYDVTLTRGGSSAVCKGAAMNHPTNNPTGINRLGFVLRDSSDSLIWIDDIRIYQGISAVDSDGDGLANIVDPDSDNDGLLDGQEMRLWGDLDSDGDGLVNVLDNDSDNDGIPDGVEVNTYSTSPVLADTDNDGLTDSQEISVYGTDPVDNDTDGDGLKDGDEVAFWLGMGLDPVVADTDGDGIRNVVDYDSDNDGFPDGWEVQNGLNPAAGQIPPTAPIGLVVTGQAGMIFIAWSPPSSIGGSDLIRYTVYRSISDGHAWGPMVCIAQVGPDVLSCDDFDVVNWTMYKYAVTANNSFGESPFSNEGWTTPLSVPDAPITLGASAFLGAVNFAWYVYPHRDGGSEVTAWRIYRGTAPGEETLLYEGFGGKGRYWDSNVANGTTYFYQVSLVNAVGEGARSEEAYATPYGPPASPRNLACTPGNGQITLSWEAPAGLDSNITCYEIYRGDYSLNESFLTNVSSGELRYTDANLGRNQTYFYRVRAVNEYGPGLFSYEANATTWTIPESPQNLTATPGVRQIGLCWSEPVSGGPPILSYIIYRGNVSGGETYFREIKPVNAEWQDIFLPNGVTYYYRISAVNTLGESPQSNEAFSTTFDVPSAPRALVAVSGKQAVSLTWLEPLSSGGTEVLHYTIYRRTETSSYLCLGTTLDGHQFTYVDGGLPNGQLYYYYVVANNSVGGSAQSNIASATTPNVPGAPSNLVATATGTTINLVWQTPPDGGSPITGYKIYRGTLPGSIPYLTTVVGVTQFSDQSLAKGQIYYYKIIAANDVGDSLPSNVVNATTWKNPSTVVNPQCTPSSTQIVLTWTKPLDNGGATDLQLSYKIYRSTSPGAEVQIATVTGTTSFTDTGRTNGQVYYYKISASNLAGDSALSYEISAKPGTAPTIPSAPLYLTAAGGGASTITLTWNVPGSNGGSPITAYKIYRSTIKGKEAYFKTATSWSIDPLTGKLKWSDYPVTGTKTYYYKISAVNGVGEGPLSNEASSLPGTSALSTYLSAASNNAESSSSILLVNPTYSTVMVGASSSATTLSMTQSLADRYYYDDNDSDGLVNGMEDFYGTSPFKPDSDGDGLSDSLEVAFWFSIGSSPTADGDNDGLVNVLDPDSAGDGMLDGQRKKFLEDLDAKNPGQPYAPSEDFDADGVVNMLEKDWDNDGVLNGKEMLAIPAGCSIDQLLVFEQDDYSSTWNQQAVMISIPLTSDGQIVPLHGGSLTVTGVESGGGLFGDRRTFDVPVSWINDIDAGDLDGDGRVDVVVSSGQSSIIGVLYNLGNAMFDNSTTVNVGGSTYGVCVGKFDGDGRADIAVSRSGTSTVAILFSNGRGAFYGPKYVSVRAGLQVLDVAAFGNQIWVTYTSSTWVTRIVASSRDSFTTTDFNVGHEARYVFPADLNGQGKVGLFLACPSQLGWELYIPGSIYAPFWYYWTSDYRVQALAPGDHDNDGQVDVIVMPSDNQACGINLALDPGYNYVTGWSNPTYLGNAARQYDVASSDIDGDGVPDIIFPVGASSIGRLLCAPFIDEGSGLNTTIVYDYRWWPTVGYPYHIQMADFTGDGYNDIIIGHEGPSGKVSLHVNGMYPTNPSVWLYSDQASEGAKQLWSYGGTFSGSITIGNVYDEILKYLASHPLVSDASDGRIDGRISFPVVIKVQSEGCLWLKSSDMAEFFYVLDPFKADTDDDGINDSVELSLGMDPTMADSDNDMIDDRAEYDYWISVGIAPTSDSDNDGFPNIVDPDSDNDGLYDGEEIATGLNPADPDYDDDGIVDYYDKSPLSAAPLDTMTWYTEYQSGMLRFTKDIDTLYFGGGRTQVYVNDQLDRTVSDGVKTYWATDYDVRKSLDDNLSLDPKLKDYKVLSLETLSNAIDCNPTYTYGPLHIDIPYFGRIVVVDKMFKFVYDRWKRTDRVTFTNRGPMPVNNQVYSLTDMNVALGKDQAVTLQFRMDANDWYLFRGENDYCVPMFQYALFKTRDWDGVSNIAFFESVALPILVDTHCYEVELRIPASVLTSSNCNPNGDQFEVVLYLSPFWLTKFQTDYGDVELRTAMDTSSMRFCAAVTTISDAAYSVYSRRAFDLEEVLSVLPSDDSVILGLSSGPHSYSNGTASYDFYVFNDLDGGTFDQSKFNEPSVDAIIVVGRSLERLDNITGHLSWGVPGVWYLDGATPWKGMSKLGKMGIKVFQREFDNTIKRAVEGWDDVKVNLENPGSLSWYSKRSMYTLCEVEFSDGQHGFRIKRDDLSFAQYPDPATGRTVRKVSAKYTDHTVDNVDDIKILMSDGTVKFRSYLIKGSVATIIVTDGYYALVAARDGDYVRTTVLAAEGALGVYGAVKGGVTWRVWELNSLSGKTMMRVPLKIGAVAAIAVGVIESGYNFVMYTKAKDYIAKMTYLQASVSAEIDTGISLSPHGLIIEASWILTTLVCYLIKPNNFALRVCITPGTAGSWLGMYLVTGAIDPVSAEDAYFLAISDLAMCCQRLNDQGYATLIVLKAK